MLSKSCFCNLASTVSSLLQVAKAQAVFAYVYVVSDVSITRTRTSSWGLNSSARRAASRATASNKRGARCDAVAKAQAVLARFWAMKRSTRPSALAAMASNNSGAASAAVAYAQAYA